MKEGKIENINVDIWQKNKVEFRANDDVNIIVGINGSGKTTFLNSLYGLLLKERGDEGVIYIRSIDNIAMRDKRKTATALSQDLDFYLYDMKTGPSLMYCRMALIDAAEATRQEQNNRMVCFLDAINELFSASRKTIEIKGNQFLVFSDGTKIEVDDLSSGEKQVLIVLLRVFLLDHKPACVLIDEPENSLDIEWQSKLIDILVKLNPNAQYFITSHSPAIFGKGWGDKVIYMSDVVKVK